MTRFFPQYFSVSSSSLSLERKKERRHVFFFSFLPSISQVKKCKKKNKEGRRVFFFYSFRGVQWPEPPYIHAIVVEWGSGLSFCVCVLDFWDLSFFWPKGRRRRRWRRKNTRCEIVFFSCGRRRRLHVIKQHLDIGHALRHWENRNKEFFHSFKFLY